MRVHIHFDDPMFLCVESTLAGWAVSTECQPERVEVCSENIIGDVTFLPNLGELLEELRRRGVRDELVETVRDQVAAKAKR
ncbi:MAG: hypothetical protein HY683_10115 [Chloroflexi bacterium]|nr:hypothetical protein [Chloroflexota bacterium]